MRRDFKSPWHAVGFYAVVVIVVGIYGDLKCKLRSGFGKTIFSAWLVMMLLFVG